MIIVLLPLAAWAQDAPDPRYRIELIVLQHLSHDELPQEQKWIEDYTNALDFLALPEEETAEEDGATPPEPETQRRPPEDDPARPLTAEGEDPQRVDDAEKNPLNRVVHLPELGPEMQDAWRRLRLSGPFRPLQQLAWEQDGYAPFPLLRVHDHQVILEQDPWAEERAAADASFEEPAAGQPDQAPMLNTAETAEMEGPIPPPLPFYRLDGTAQLTRSRFLHLALDVVWREAVYGELPLPPPLPSSSPSTTDADAEQPMPTPESFLVHRLQQRRQVRTDRLEYFDGPVLGVLARISRVAAGESALENPPEEPVFD